jgi:hypothetical protein
MDEALKNNFVKIYDLKYCNGAYGYGFHTVYDTFPTVEYSGYIGATGSIGATGPTGYVGSDHPSNFYEQRTLKSKSCNAYQIEIAPRNNTQESYDEVVCPFLDLDDIGVNVEIRNPIVTHVRLNIKPEFLAAYNHAYDHNTKCEAFNRHVHEAFNQIKNASVEEYENIKTTIISKLPDDLINSEEVKSTITQIITDFTNYRTNQNEEDNNNEDDDYDRYSSSSYDYDDDQPSTYSYHKSTLYINNDWYDYRHDVSFNGTSKVSIKCHEGTKMFTVINNFLN